MHVRRSTGPMPTGRFRLTRRRVPHATWPLARGRPLDDVECCALQRRGRRCPRGGRDGHPAADLDTVARQRQVQRGIERMQTVVTARRRRHRNSVGLAAQKAPGGGGALYPLNAH